MSDEEMEKLAALVRVVVKEEIKPLSDLVGTLTSSMESLTGTVKTLAKTVESLANVVDSLANNVNTLTENVESLTSNVETLADNVGSLTKEVEIVKDQVVTLTEKVDGEIIPTLEKHTEYFKRIVKSQNRDEDNIERLDKRLVEAESKIGIQPPPEFHLIK